MDKLKTSIEREGQPFFDEPVYANPKTESAISRMVRNAIGDKSTIQPLLVEHRRVKLNWIKPEKSK